MLCYVFKVRSSSFMSKRDSKEKKGWNVALICLEGAKFHLETFIDSRDKVFAPGGNLEKIFAPGFWDIDIDEFEVFTPNGSQYQKKIISVIERKKIDDALKYFT